MGIADPRQLTIRQLLLMTEGRDRFAWGIASSVMALIANCHVYTKRKAFVPGDFNPFTTKESKRGVLVTKENIQDFRDAFQGLRRFR